MKHEFILNKRKIIVVAKIKGVRDFMSFKFILDTGASKTVIDSSVASLLGFNLKELGNERLTTIGGMTNSKIMKLPEISLFGKNMANFEVNVLDFSPQITYFAVGLIGTDFLLKFKSMKIDFEEKIIET